MAQEHVVEIVVDDEQLLRQLLVGDPGDELQHPLLHGSARPVELLPRKQVEQAWAPDQSKAISSGRALAPGDLGEQSGLHTGLELHRAASGAPQTSL